MTPLDDRPSAASRRAGVARALQAAATAILLAVVGGRCLLGELPYRTASLQVTAAGTSQRGGFVPGADRGEAARASLALLLLLAGTIALAADASNRQRRGGLPWPVLAAMAGFAVWAGVSARGAGDARAAWLVWLEQLSLLVAAALGARLLGSRTGLALWTVVLAGLAGAMAAKGLWQRFVEVPERIADFQAYRADRLAQLGWQEGTPQARMIETRISDPAPTGYVGLANLFASTMLPLLGGAIALAVAKGRWAIGWWRAYRDRLKRGEVPAPALAAVLTALLAASAGLVLGMTGSLGATVAALAGAVGAAVTWRFRATLARRRRRAVLAVGIVAVLVGGAVVAWGMRHDGLPTRTMTFRWFYWSAAGEIVADRPLLGVGGGNFADAYLRVRRAAGEEAVKTPHNVLMHAATQFGLPGAAMYVLTLGGLLLGATRPAASTPRTGAPEQRTDAVSPPDPQQAAVEERRGWLVRRVGMLAAVVAGALLARLAFFDWAQMNSLLVLEVILPASAVAAALALAAWGAEGGLVGPFERVVLAAACGAFVLHNLVTFSLWAPAPAGLAWVTLGALSARPERPGGLASGRGRWVRRAAVTAATLLAGAGVAWSARSLWWPVMRRVRVGDALLSAVGARRRAEVWDLARRYASADPLDPIAPRDASRAALWATPREEGPLRSAGLELADALAIESVRRDGSSPAAWRHLGTVRGFRHHGDAYAMPGQVPPSPDPGAVERLRERVARRPGDRIAAHDLAMHLTAAGALGEAYIVLSRIAVELPRSPAAALNAGDAAWRLGREDAAGEHWARGGRLWRARGPDWSEGPAWMMACAVDRNPQSIRLRIASADAYSRVGRLAAARFEIANARRIDAALLGRSVEKLTPRERRDLEMIEARAQAVHRAVSEAGGSVDRARARRKGGR